MLPPVKKSISCCLLHQNPATYLFRAVLACIRCLICADFSPDSDQTTFHWRKHYYGLWTRILAGSNGLNFEVKTSWWICFSFCLLKMLIDGLEWCGLLVDYCDVFISCLDSHSDGTHSLQSIRCWASDGMLHFSKSDEETNSSTSWMTWGWAHFQQMFIFGWTIPFCFSSKCILI